MNNKASKHRAKGEKTVAGKEKQQSYTCKWFFLQSPDLNKAETQAAQKSSDSDKVRNNRQKQIPVKHNQNPS